MILGRTSTKKLAYKKREILSNVKRKTKTPSLCLNCYVLWMVFDLKDTLAPFKSFSAYYLWEISSFYVLFILDFKLHSQRFI